jgi:hypothetical protein
MFRLIIQTRGRAAFSRGFAGGKTEKSLEISSENRQ